MESKVLTINTREIEGRVPIGLQYFQAVDAITKDVPPIDRIYFDILVYEAGKDQPQVKILRIQNNYLDGNISKQDEIELKDKEHRLQFNAECDSKGNYIKYPETPSEEALKYLNETVGEFSRLARINDSIIIINGRNRMVSSKGLWWIVEENKTNPKPRLNEPKK